ncbi:cercosporin toxin biosynthesis protein [Lophium mytilinum]|uniref:Cercosporin toxin biosynthesis protein n=1 Tax=Lophium mytilinum TaxID=390894 RepID=A0A6A6QPP0_9PEZI|nr:cercosporin toxin biosynthesis protein [Lophium mytilinum]
MATSRILQLAHAIVSGTSTIDQHLRDHDIAEPSFSSSEFAQSLNPTPDVEAAKTTVIEATIELRQLLEGPMQLLLPESNFFPLAAIHRFNIASHVPTTPDNASISFRDLAQRCGLQEQDVQRIVRFTAAHHRVFCEPDPGRVAHTAASRSLVEIPVAQHLMALTFQECWPAHGRALDAMEMKSQEPSDSGFSLANGTRLGFFEFLSQNPDRAKGFAGAMSSTSSGSLEALSRSFDWASLGPRVVVDVGGSVGHVSAYLASQYPELRFLVQDKAEVVQDAEEKIPVEVRDRVTFQAHDFFDEQNVKADAYLLRFVLHDWPDKWCLKILRALVPRLQEGAVLVLQEHILPEPGSVGLLKERRVRSMDAIMLSLLNSREREERDWRSLFEEADKRFRVEAVERKEGETIAVITVRWTG